MIPGGSVDEILQTINNNGLKPVYILATHGHFDHIGGIMDLQKSLDCQFLLNSEDSNLAESLAEQALFFGFNVYRETDSTWHIESRMMLLKLGDMEIKIIETPGHTPGSVSLLTNNKLFVGDTVFQGSIGRTDLPGGSYETLDKLCKRETFLS